jgi:hypothetical protein
MRIRKYRSTLVARTMQPMPERGQDPGKRELRAWCANSGHTISREYVERESGRKGAGSNSLLSLMMRPRGNLIVCCSGLGPLQPRGNGADDWAQTAYSIAKSLGIDRHTAVKYAL